MELLFKADTWTEQIKFQVAKSKNLMNISVYTYARQMAESDIKSVKLGSNKDTKNRKFFCDMPAVNRAENLVLSHDQVLAIWKLLGLLLSTSFILFIAELLVNINKLAFNV